MRKAFTLDDIRNSPAGKLNQHLFQSDKRPVTKPKAEPLEHQAPGVINVAMQIKPMSVNGAWKGQRFKTDEYKAYEARVIAALPDLTMPAPPYRVIYEFGVSSEQSDFDNPVKPLTDILQKKYSFNDKKIFEARIKKVIVEKGEEYFTVTIETII